MTVTPSPKTNVYVDGFNLYYGCLRDTPDRWLDISALLVRMFPGNAINRIRYFTARVKAMGGDPQKPTRQQVYLRAIATLPNLTIHEGSFKINKVKRELVTPLADGTTHVRVRDPKEKGSDVALATYLLADGFQGDYDVAIVVSNDTDLCRPVEMVRTVLKRDVVVAAPCSLPGRYPSDDLRKAATSMVSISGADLAACQFPATLVDAHGTITKPATW